MAIVFGSFPRIRSGCRVGWLSRQQWPPCEPWFGVVVAGTHGGVRRQGIRPSLRDDALLQASSLNDLDYRLPAGFTRFVVEVTGPERDVLEPFELETVAAALGRPVRQVFAQYRPGS